MILCYMLEMSACFLKGGICREGMRGGEVQKTRAKGAFRIKPSSQNI